MLLLVKLNPLGKLSAPSSASDPGSLLLISKTDRLNSDGDRFTEHDVLPEFGYTLATGDNLFYKGLSYLG